jgi:hypothetical protein
MTKILLSCVNHCKWLYPAWRLFLRVRYGKDFIGTYRNIPMLKSDNLISDSEVTKDIQSGKIR